MSGYQSRNNARRRQSSHDSSDSDGPIAQKRRSSSNAAAVRSSLTARKKHDNDSESEDENIGGRPIHRSVVRGGGNQDSELSNRRRSRDDNDAWGERTGSSIMQYSRWKKRDAPKDFRPKDSRAEEEKDGGYDPCEDSKRDISSKYGEKVCDMGEIYKSKDEVIEYTAEMARNRNRTESSSSEDCQVACNMDEIYKPKDNVEYTSEMARQNEKGSSRTLGSRDFSSPGFPLLLTAYESGPKTEHIQCIIVRSGSAMKGKLFPTYELFLEDNKKPLLSASKMGFNRTSNYHIFDMTRGQPGKAFSKKSGNYIGKLRAVTMQRSEYVLVGNASDREELAAYAFDVPSLISNLTEGSQPRKLSAVVVPRLNDRSMPIAHRVCEEGACSLTDLLYGDRCATKGLHKFHSKEPENVNGRFLLDFKGRVSRASVKNCQLVSEADKSNIICQFGKVGDDEYHLDFKAPLNALQAFALALCQFDL